MSTNVKQRSRILMIAILFAFSGFILNFEAHAQRYLLNFGHYAPDTHPMGQSARRFAELVKHRSRGQLEIRLVPQSQLGSIQEMFEATQVGSLDITLAPVAYLRSISPKMDVLEVPFLFRNFQEADRILDVRSRIGQQLIDELRRGNMEGLAFWEMGFRNISTSRRPIKGPWDLKGLKIRVYSNQALLQAFRLLGANPVQIPFGDLYVALQRGVVDGQEGTIDSIYRYKLFETQRYLSLTRHSYTALVLVMNARTFQKLRGGDQESVLSAAREAAAFGRGLSRELENNNIRQLEKSGMRIEMNPDWDEFRKRVFYEVQEKFVREDGRRLLDQINRFLD